MPGRQMAIDADLNAGTIDEKGNVGPIGGIGDKVSYAVFTAEPGQPQQPGIMVPFFTDAITNS